MSQSNFWALCPVLQERIFDATGATRANPWLAELAVEFGDELVADYFGNWHGASARIQTAWENRWLVEIMQDLMPKKLQNIGYRKLLRILNGAVAYGAIKLPKHHPLTVRLEEVQMSLDAESLIQTKAA